MAKIVLVNPPHWYLSHHAYRPEAPPLGLLYLASILRKEHEVTVYDAEYFAHSPLSLSKYLQSIKPDIVGFTSTVLSYIGMQQSIVAIRNQLPKTKILIGGAMVTSLSDEEIKEKFDFDLCIKGECEGNVLQLVNEDATGIMYGIPAKDINDIPPPSRDLQDPSYLTYMGNVPHFRKPEVQMMWSRGCPHSCIFCSNPVFGRRQVRFRDPHEILAELKELYADGVRGIFVYDDELVGLNGEQINWLENVCDLIIQSGIKIDFKCQGRCNPNVIPSRLLHKMNKVGFKAVMWGVESGSPQVLKSIKKGITPEDVKETFKKTKQAGIKNFAFIMVGNYNEGNEDIKQTVDLLETIHPDWVQVTCCTPLKPAEFYKLNAHNIIEKRFPFFLYPICGTDTLSMSEIQEWYFTLDRKFQKKFTIRQNMPKYLYESLFTLKGINKLPYRINKFLRLRKEGII